MGPQMIRCRELAELLTSDRLADARLRVRMEAKLHLWMCRHCARFARQMKLLRAAARSLAESYGLQEPEASAKALEDRLIHRLSKWS